MEGVLLKAGTAATEKAPTTILTFLAPTRQTPAAKQHQHVYETVKHCTIPLFDAFQAHTKAKKYWETPTPDPASLKCPYNTAAMASTKDLETQANAIKDLEAFEEEGKLHPANILRLFRLVANHQRIKSLFPEAETWQNMLPLEKTPIGEPTTLSPPEIISVSIPQRNFEDIALQFARGRGLVSGTVSNTFSRAVSSCQHGPHAKPTIHARSKMQSTGKHAVAPTTRVYPMPPTLQHPAELNNKW